MSEQVDQEFDDIIQRVEEPSYTAPVSMRARVLSEQRLPVLPAWARDRDEFSKAARWKIGHEWHRVKFHATHAPMYTARGLSRCPRGLVRLIVLTVAWARDNEAARRLAAMHEDPDNHEYVRLREMRVRSVQTRSALVFIAIAAAIFFYLGVLPTLDLQFRALGVVAPLAVLAKLGEREDQPIVSHAIVPTHVQELTPDVVKQALREALPGIRDPEKHPITFPSSVTRDGAGQRADVDLPPGVTAADVIERRDKLAAALRRPQGAVWPEPAPDVHPGRLVLWVGDRDMADGDPPKWPLAKKGTVNVFDPIPFGVDQRGRPVTITLMFASMVVGAIPRMGKTFSVRLLALAAALDRRCQLHLYNLKGGSDFGAFKPIAHRYRVGDDIEDVEYAITAMRELQAEMRRRAKVIEGLPSNVCPESKVTDQLASMRQHRLHPILLVVDECQRWFEKPDHGKELEAIAEDLVRRGPSYGIFACFATQRPDAKSLPTGISDNAVLRFCLKVMGQVPNDQVLGTSSYRAGIRATLFKRTDLGIGLLAGEGDEPRVVRTYFVDNPSAEAIVERARVVREAAGMLTGDAAGDTIADSGGEARLLVDILAVVPVGEEKVATQDVCDRLADHRADLYGQWRQTGDKHDDEAKRSQLALQLRNFGIATRQLRPTQGPQRVQACVRREWVVDALEDRI